MRSLRLPLAWYTTDEDAAVGAWVLLEVQPAGGGVRKSGRATTANVFLFRGESWGALWFFGGEACGVPPFVGGGPPWARVHFSLLPQLHYCRPQFKNA